ncbi:MAG: TIGR00282 family metallophosphoesterase [Selenomonadaceae bacterium]|nr:TIGR00282 family metallophosphoesterase [Selenomonadaceae bacterium]MBQ3725976.1 TIGR00282 family metallophosphoesterase [Selenomonadaceae bacterium]
MKILMVGDVVGRTGRYFFMEQTPELRQAKKIDVVIVNGENAAHGKGLTPSIFSDLIKGGADIVTSGNHIWDNPKVLEIIDTEPFLLRPANYPEDTPGRGFCIFPVGRKKIGVINLAGRIFMNPPLDDPFRLAEKILRLMRKDCDLILVDFHAEATSEKLAFANYFDGQVTAVVGTHTHVQTADEKILPKGTAYITDLGMVGAQNSILGMTVEPVIKRFLTGRPSKFEVAEGAAVYCAVLINIDDKKNKPTKIERILLKENSSR